MSGKDGAKERKHFIFNVEAFRCCNRSKSTSNPDLRVDF
jgi:hypothetical protein